MTTVLTVHPIERLRAVARSRAAPPALLAREAATALGIFGDDPAGLVIACRRLVDRQPTCAPLWWLASRVLSSIDPTAEAWASVAALEDDPTEEALLCCLDARDGEVGAPVVVQATALGVDGFVCEHSALAPMSAAHGAALPIWVVARVGVALPARLWASYLSRIGVEAGAPAGVHGGDASGWVAVPGDANLVVCTPAWASMVVGPTGLASFEEAARGVSCPVAPELLRPLA